MKLHKQSSSSKSKDIEVLIFSVSITLSYSVYSLNSLTLWKFLDCYMYKGKER